MTPNPENAPEAAAAPLTAPEALAGITIQMHRFAAGEEWEGNAWNREMVGHAADALAKLAAALPTADLIRKKVLRSDYYSRADHGHGFLAPGDRAALETLAQVLEGNR